MYKQKIVINYEDLLAVCQATIVKLLIYFKFQYLVQLLCVHLSSFFMVQFKNILLVQHWELEVQRSVMILRLQIMS